MKKSHATGARPGGRPQEHVQSGWVPSISGISPPNHQEPFEKQMIRNVGQRRARNAEIFQGPQSSCRHFPSFLSGGLGPVDMGGPRRSCSRH